MAEPLILAYGRGELPEFPAAADTIVDIVPVDHVVAAIVAVLAHPPEPGDAGVLPRLLRRPQPADLQRRSTSSCARTSTTHPFDRAATAARPGCRSGGSRRAARSSGCSSTSERACKVADYVVGHAPAQRPHPRPGPQARPAGPAAGVPAPLPRPLHGVRHRPSCSFSDSSTLALLRRRCPRTTGRRSPSTPRSSTGTHYLSDVHCPAVTAPIRRLDELRALRKKPAAVALRKALGSSSAGVAAFFDMDGTLLSSNVIETYLWMRLRELVGSERLAELGRIAAQGAEPGPGRAPRAQRLPARGLPRVRRRPARRPRRDRRRAPHRPRAVPALAGRRTPDPRAPRRRPPDRADHRRDPAADPAAAPLFDHIEAAELAVDDRGVCTGYLAVVAAGRGVAGRLDAVRTPPSTAST